MKAVLGTLLVSMVSVSPALAADTSKVYTSGILVLLFVGFCALLVVAQLLPAVMNLLGVTKQAAKNVKSRQVAESKSTK